MMQIVFFQSQSYHQAYEAINDNQVDVVYPYGCGVYQWRADYDMQVYDEFVSKLDTSVLDKVRHYQTQRLVGRNL
jgi:hypothetical protein